MVYSAVGISSPMHVVGYVPDPPIAQRIGDHQRAAVEARAARKVCRLLRMNELQRVDIPTLNRLEHIQRSGEEGERVRSHADVAAANHNRHPEHLPEIIARRNNLLKLVPAVRASLEKIHRTRPASPGVTADEVREVIGDRREAAL